MRARRSPSRVRFGRGWWFGPQALRGRPEGLLVAAIAIVTLILLTFLELWSPASVVLAAFVFIPVLGAAWLLSGRLALMLLILAVGLRLGVAAVRPADPVTLVADVLALGIAAAMARLASRVARQLSRASVSELTAPPPETPPPLPTNDSDAGRHALALHTLDFSALQRGNFTDTESVLLRGIALARPDRSPSGLGSLLSALAATYALEGRMSEAQELLKPSPANGQRATELNSFGTAALVHWLAGQFGLVVMSVNTTLHGSGSSQPRRDWGLLLASMAAAELGHTGEGQTYLSRASMLFAGEEYILFSSLQAWASGFLAWREGDVPEASRRMQAAADALLAMDAQPAAAFVLIDLAEVASQSGERNLVAQVAGQLSAIADRLNRDLYRALAWMGSAWSLLSIDDVSGATKAAQQAAHLLAPGHYAAYLARSLDLLAQPLAIQDRDEAIKVLNRAVTIHGLTGAAWRAERTLKLLQRLKPLGPRAVATTAGLRPLTRREREVAHLAAQGHSARDIARQLSITDRTAETHLANAYAKLGVHSRQDLMQRASELGIQRDAAQTADVAP